MQPTTDLQAAIDAAASDSTLTLCPGTWTVPHTVVIRKNLTLVGAGIDQTILDGGTRIRVLTVEAVTVTLENLTITRGKSSTAGGGLSNGGNLTLRNVAVTANRAELGGGIVQGGGTLTLAAGTQVAGNFAILQTTGTGGSGGGICLLQGSNALAILEAGSSVTGNTASHAGGGIWTYSPSAVTLQAGSTVSNNTTVSSNTEDNCEPTIGTCT